MERKRALVIAGSVGLSVLAGGAAMAANFGLLDAAGDGSPVGELDASNVRDLAAVPVADTSAPTDGTTDTSAEVVIIDEWVTEPGGAPVVVDGSPSSSPAMDPGGAPAPVPGAASGAPLADQPGTAPAGTEAPRAPAPGATSSSGGPEHESEYEHEEESEHEAEYEHEEEEEEEKHDDDHAESEHEEEDD